MKNTRQGRNFPLYQAYEQLVKKKIVQFLSRKQLQIIFSRFKAQNSKISDYDHALNFCKSRIRKLEQKSVSEIEKTVGSSYGMNLTHTG